MAEPKRLIDVVGLEELPLADVLAKTSTEAVAQAWAAGDIDFGHRKYCTTGQPGKSASSVIIEDGYEWTLEGKTTRGHKQFTKFTPADLGVPPEVASYCRADLPRVEVPDPTDPNRQQKMKVMPTVPREEAVKMLQLHVRLSDKGAAKIRVA